MKNTIFVTGVSVLFVVGAAWAGELAWSIDSQKEWQAAHEGGEQVELVGGQVRSLQPESSFSSAVKSFKTKRAAGSITFRQSDDWTNWKEIPNVGVPEMDNALIFLPVKPGEYYILGRHSRYQSKRIGDKKEQTQKWLKPDFSKEVLEEQGGYHAWYSTDMETWKHCGPVSSATHGKWMVSAEYANGRFYLYYDFPNDQDPHLWVDDNLRDGKPGKNYGMVLDDPTHGSDSAVIRDEDGSFHIIFENWDFNNPKVHSWDAPVAGHAVSPDGIQPFTILAHFPVDERTTPTGEMGTYKHSSSNGKPFSYKIHEPEQNAYGDWTAIKVGGQYYLFGDFHPVGERIKIGCFTSDSLNNRFRFCNELGGGHPDPSVGFAEGQFYLIQQSGEIDFISSGPWVPGVEARVGVDVDGDKKIDHWTAWQEVRETYAQKPGFARIVDTEPAQLNAGDLPEGYGFAFEYRTRSVDGQSANVVMNQVEWFFK